MSDKHEFLYQSILDTQGTIRAIDIKVSFALLILLSPLAISPQIVEIVHCHRQDVFFLILVLLSTLIWISGLLIAFRALIGIGNSVSQIAVRNQLPKGLFYSEYLFADKFPEVMVFQNQPAISNVTFEEHLKNIQNSNIESELTFEQMKLCYIRDLKMLRQHYLFKFAALWISLVILTVIYKLMTLVPQ